VGRKERQFMDKMDLDGSVLQIGNYERKAGIFRVGFYVLLWEWIKT